MSPVDLPPEDGLRAEFDGAVLRLTLCRPDVRNAQTPRLWQHLADVLADAEARSVAVVTVAGEGKSFSAGLDRRMFTADGVPGQGSFLTIARNDRQDIIDQIGEYQRGFAALTEGPFITIAAVQGHAVGAGFQLALACDLIVCAQDARFSMREVSYGLVPDLTGTSPLVRTIGYPRALEICATGRWVTAQEGLDLGLVFDVVPEDALLTRTDELAQALVKGIPGTAAAIKRVLRSAVIASPQEQRLVERTAQSERIVALAAMIGDAQPA